MEESQSSHLATHDKITIKTISVNKYIVLAITSFGLYNIWWIYKSWWFFREIEKSGILAAVRTIFSIIFLLPLFYKIRKLSQQYDYKLDYSSILVFLGFFITNLLSYLPEPYFLVTIFSFIFIIPPLKALNFAIRHNQEIQAIEQEKFNGRQIFIIIIGSLLWLLVLIGLLI